jgi:M6 family metalloprotease-like protein
MTRTRTFVAASLAVVMATAIARTAPETAPPPRQILTGYRTVAEAIKADRKQFNFSGTSNAAPAGWLGVVIAERDGKPVIDSIAPESPAEAAGLAEGDEVVRIGDKPAASATAVRDILRGKLAGDRLTLEVSRGGKTIAAIATLAAASKPMSATSQRVLMGVTLGDPGGGGIALYDVEAKGPADQGGMKVGDVVLSIDGRPTQTDTAFRDALSSKQPGDRVDVVYSRGGKQIETKVFVVPEVVERKGGRGTGGGAGWDDRIPRAWRKPTYRLAILGVEYPDVKHNAKIKDSDWEESMFSLGKYTGESATGQKVHGSMNDYYRELSSGTFKVDGKFVGWVEVSKKRMEYTTGSGTSSREKQALLTEALDVYTKKHGKEALAEFDGIFYLYAGERVNTSRGGLYWPHRANIRYGGRSLPYFIVQEGGSRMNDISVFCHEFGHMLGLPDLYARPEQPGSEGVWQWCAMANQIGNGRPQHFSVWCKEQLGWARPTVIDPRVKQKLALSPIETDPTQCVKVMVRADGSEFFLLEVRQKVGWDERLPGEGLLIWRVVNNRPILEESHGVEGARGPSIYPTSVPFPSAANQNFTPYTTPSSKSQLGGGLPVWITNIRRWPDGRVTFHVGYEYQ